jgi:hypothetical protein
VGFEPTDKGFADLPLRPLGYRAKLLSIAKTFTGARKLAPAARGRRYFFAGANGETIFASRKKRADSSGGVGLM